MRGTHMRMRVFAAALLLGLAMSTPDLSLDAQDRPLDRAQARSMVISRYGIVAAESPLAARAGVAMLESGGTAADAAVAANAMMGLVAPMSNGIGGDLFAIVYDAKSGKLYGLNASGPSPARLSPDMLERQGIRAMPLRGINTVTVPGAVDGWAKLLERFGKKKFPEVLAPAIRAAEEGFPVGEIVGTLWGQQVGVLQGDETAARTFLIENRAPRAGEIFRNPDLAWSLKQIAAKGRDAFYKGDITFRIVDKSRRHAGVLAATDFAEYEAEWVEPISTTYRDWTVYELPPNGQGIAALEMLNIMENFPLGEYGFASTRALHTMIEAKKLAYADLIRHIGDPRARGNANLPVAGMLSKDYAKARAKLIDPDKANCSVAAGDPVQAGSDTIYLSVVDRDGNMVSLIQSNYENFGSGLVAEGTGFALQNRGALFNLDPKSPNVLAGHKRPLHTIIPAMMQKGDLRIAFGIMGGWNQSQAHAQFVANVVDFKMNIQMALEAPRFTKRTFEGCDLQMENRVPPQVRNDLIAKGHVIDVRGVFSSVMGGGQAVARNFATNVNFGASDPRKDGAAILELPPEK